jgi:hypothetical protein
MSKTLPTLREALDALNWSYGRGDVVGIDWDPTPAPDGAKVGRVACKKQFGYDRPKVTLRGGTVYFRGHQRKVG